MSTNANLRGAGLMTASMASFTLNDVFVKLLAEDLPLFQIVFLRGILTTGLLIGLAGYYGQLRFNPQRGDGPRLAWRTFFEMATVIAFLSALVNMPIANATAILAVVPLSVTVAAALFLGEPLGWRRMSAIAVGFGGVMLIVQPGGAGFNAWSVSALLAVLFITGRDLMTRQLSSGLPSLGVAVVTAAAVCAVGGVLSVFQTWEPMGLREVFFLALASVFIIGGYLFSIMVMRVGDVAASAPFRYTGLVFALIFGFLFFAEWPNVLAFAGATVVVATGIYAIFRERAVAARAKRLAVEAKGA